MIDTHCHLTYLDQTPENVLKAARARGVKGFMTISCREEDFQANEALAKSHEDVWYTVGIHPHDTEKSLKHRDLKSWEKMLSQWAQDPKMVALGETGLDYFYDHSHREIQKDFFKSHLQLARKTGKPLVVHTRDAEKDTVAILQQGQGHVKGVLHCFSGSSWLCKEALDLGFYISASGIITFKKAQDLRDIFKEVPLDRLLVETDAPYLAPVPHRGKPNEPAYVMDTAACLADLRGLSLEELDAITTHNAQRLFSLTHSF